MTDVIILIDKTLDELIAKSEEIERLLKQIDMPELENEPTK